MRQRIKVCICSHAQPNGFSRQGRREQLKKKFQRGNISSEELREYAEFLAEHAQEEPTMVIVIVWGKKQYVPFSEYKERYEQFGFSYEAIR